MWWHLLRIKATTWCLFLISLLSLFGFSRPKIQGLSATDASSQGKPCTHQDTQHRYLMLVSTLDGQLAALDVDKQGKLEWSTETGSTPLLSSSISKLEIVRNGVPFRLIPSLDGGLYQFDGDNVEALPFTADTLLTSSSRLNEDSVVVGGKESMTYGVDLKTGKVHYVCQASGCNQYKDGTTKTSEDIIMIKRNTQTVRAVEMRTGEEKWNFSVGQHDVTFLEGERPDRSPDDDDVTITTCNSHDDTVKAKLKVFVPNGLIIAVDEDDPTRVLWKYQFGIPIAKAWTLNHGTLEELSLFDFKNVPALGPEPGGKHKDEKTPPQPMLYLGFHHSQMYVQPSLSMTEEIAEVVEKMARSHGTDVLSMPRVKWKPYIATASSRTPIIHSKVPLLDYDSKKHVTTYPGVKRHERDDAGAVIVKNDFDYPYDNGFYIFNHESGAQTTSLDDADTEGGAYQYITVINGSLWLWWKEVVLISLTTSIFLHLFINRYLHRGNLLMTDSTVADRKSSDSGVSLSQTNNIEIESELPRRKSQSCPELTPSVEFSSRYYNDFEHLRCLGKGGFGVVFEAKNKMDECSYAVKRICVKNSEESKEKVMREARALAKLDHVGIVRYYQVWIETPPPGWQEERDADLVSCGEYIGTDTCSPTSLSAFTTKNTDRLSPVKEEINMKNKIKNISPHSHHNPLRPFDDSGDSWGNDRSLGFSPNFRKDLENDESGSFSLGVGTPAQLEPLLSEDSEVIFKNSDTEDSNDISVPFNLYKDVSKKSVTFEDTNSSFNIVFEDSGCADRSSNGNDDVPMDNDVSEASSLNDIVVQGSKTSSDWSVSNPNLMRHSKSDMFVPRSAPKNIPGINHVNRTDYHSSLSTVSSMSEKLPKLYLYIQMQLCRRETLKEWLNSNTLRRNTHELLDFFHQIVSAVQYVHDNGLMHRDLKPSNIFFSMDGVIKIGDFGLVTTSAQKNEVAQFEGDQRYQDRHTDQVGTQLYMSPEQISSQTYSQKVDIFSLGLIFLELFFPFSTQMERIRVLTDAKKQQFPERFQRELPEECNFVKWLLSPTPDKRPSAKEILSHKMLSDFQPAPKTHRSRTISTSSSGSDDQKNSASI